MSESQSGSQVEEKRKESPVKSNPFETYKSHANQQLEGKREDEEDDNGR